MLYNVFFTTRHIVSKFDQRGNKIGEYTDNIPQTLTMLPHSMALQYKDLDNFRMEPYVPEAKRASTSGKFRHGGYEARKDYYAKSTAKRSSAKKPNNVNDAAATGDLAAAINGATV